METELPRNPFLGSAQMDIHKRRNIENLWMSLLPGNANDEEFVPLNYDNGLQGMWLLLQTVFSHFKGTYCKLENVETQLETVRKELQFTQVKCKELESTPKNCVNCKKLQAELAEITTRHQRFESVVMSAMQTLNPPVSGSKQRSNTAMKKAFSIMTQALQGTQDVLLFNEQPEEDSPPRRESSPVKTGMQKRSLDEVGSPNEIPSTPQPERSPKRHAKFTLQLRSSYKCPTEARVIVPETMDPQLHLPHSNMVVPESLDDPVGMEENLWENTTLSCLPETSPGKTDARRVLADLSQNVESTPKKTSPAPDAGSPILGHSGKKGSGKGNLAVREFSPYDMFEDSHVLRRNVQRLEEMPSPSLLGPGKTEQVKGSGVLGSQSCLNAKTTSTNSPKPEVKIVKLDKSGEITYERREGVQRKMKQQKLSLASFNRPKQDISSLKEFNGGIRAQASDLAVELLDMDEQQQLELAKRESLLEEQKRRNQLALAGQWCPDMSDVTVFVCPIPDAAPDDDEVIPPSPDATPKEDKKCLTDRRDPFEGGSLSFDPKVTSTAQIAPSEKVDNTMTMSTFAPNFCSTAANLNEMESENPDLQALLEEMGKPDNSSLPPRLQTSFDRFPSKNEDKPDYKYKRNAMRKKSDRDELEGWDCQECAKYYRISGIDPKKAMNKCSRHRERFAPPSSTPPGFWDPGFPSTESLRGRNK